MLDVFAPFIARWEQELGPAHAAGGRAGARHRRFRHLPPPHQRDGADPTTTACARTDYAEADLILVRLFAERAGTDPDLHVKLALHYGIRAAECSPTTTWIPNACRRSCSRYRHRLFRPSHRSRAPTAGSARGIAAESAPFELNPPPQGKARGRPRQIGPAPATPHSVPISHVARRHARRAPASAGTTDEMFWKRWPPSGAGTRKPRRDARTQNRPLEARMPSIAARDALWRVGIGP